MATYQDDDKTIYYTALHSQVLVAYVTDPNTMTYKAYIYPVPGMSHETEARLWRGEGNKLGRQPAYGIWEALVQQLEEKGYSWDY